MQKKALWGFPLRAFFAILYVQFDLFLEPYVECGVLKDIVLVH